MHGMLVLNCSCMVGAPRFMTKTYLSLFPPGIAMQVSYSRFMSGLFQHNISLNRKVLSELAMTEPWSFKALVDQVRFMRGDATASPSSQKSIEAAGKEEIKAYQKGR